MDRLIQKKPVALSEPAVGAKEANATVLVDRLREPFDQQMFQVVLDDMILKFKSLHKNMEISMLRQPYKIVGEKVIFFLSGEIQTDIFLKIRPEITRLIRESLKNDTLDLAFEIKEDAVSAAAKLYTSTDKLNYLRAKSPALKELQKRFGLETDF